jgi:hypothetical protein
MEIKNMVICSATKQKYPEDTLLYQSLCDMNLDGEFDVNIATENTHGLAKVYNVFLDQALTDDRDCVILVHDDVYLEHNPIPKLEKLFNDYDLVGVAGCSRAEIKSPALWHLMGGGFYNGEEPCKLHGAVQHYKKISPNIGMVYEVKEMTNFGYYPHRVVMIDGVFMAFNRKAIEQLRFDEGCPSDFHFYDLLCCKKALELGLKIGVGDVMITHASPGLREYTTDWLEGEKYYLNKYGR